MYSRNSEPVRFERDCAVVLVPQGDNVTLPAGSVGYITQALGGSIRYSWKATCSGLRGGCRRHRQGPAQPLALPPGADDAAVEQWCEAVAHLFRPEIPINVVDLGLVYDAGSSPRPTAGAWSRSG